MNLPGSPLTAADFASLSNRAIGEDDACAALLRRVTSLEGGELVGRNGAGNWEGIVIPYILPGENRIREVRIRRDHPDIENGKPKLKYVAPPGRSNMLYFPIGTDPAWLLDVELPLVVTEGEFKAIALFGLARHGQGEAADRPRFLPVSLPGVWNFRGVIGKTVDASGTRVNEKGPIPDLSRIRWNGRLVTIIFDADLESNESVRAARGMLTRELESRGAKVRWLVWPPQVPDGVKGIDDLLAIVGPERVLEMIARAEQQRTRASKHDDSAIIKRLADAITTVDRFAKDAGGRLYVYQDGVYRQNGEGFIKARVKELLLDWELAARWRSITAKETVEYIGVDAPSLESRPSGAILNVLNGLLDLNSGGLLPHSPDYRSSLQIPVRYDPSAGCPATKKFLGEVLPSDCQGLYFQLIAWLMAMIDHIQKAVLLIGEGSNGKSTLIAALTAFLGKQNVSGIPLHRLEADRFSTVRLLGKLANICADLPSAHLAGTSVFKALTGGDDVLAERKFMDSFEFRPFARLVLGGHPKPAIRGHLKTGQRDS